MPFPFKYVEEKKQKKLSKRDLGPSVEVIEDYRHPSGTIIAAGSKGRIYDGNLPGGSVLGDELPVILEGTDSFLGIDKLKLRYL